MFFCRLDSVQQVGVNKNGNEVRKKVTSLNKDQVEMKLTANASVKLSSCLETLETAVAIFCFVTNMTSENDNPCNDDTVHITH